jgi:hypothetical protein
MSASDGRGTKLNADWDHINRLMKVGRERADAWLAANSRGRFAAPE